ncbi:MAG: hypothetical protein D6712_19245 [Chloroflexi bacterium]|nr:MAG: hypothetical protein D6712_19245 [Chloroflexota bacterium]
MIRRFFGLSMKYALIALIMIVLLSTTLVYPATLRVQKGDTLKHSLDAFVRANGWQLVWNYPADFPLVADASISGDVVGPGGVVEQVLASIADYGPFGRPVAVVYPKNKVIEIRSSEDKK